MGEREKRWRRDCTRRGMRGTGAGPSLWVPRVEVAGDSEKQVQYLEQVRRMISDKEGGGEESGELGSWSRSG